MLVPTDPKSSPTLLSAVRQSLKHHADHVVVSSALAIHIDEERRTCDLSDSETESVISALRGAAIARVSSSKGSSMPPYFALFEKAEYLDLQYSKAYF